MAVHVNDARGDLAAGSIVGDGVAGQGAGRDARRYLLDEAVLDKDVAGDPFPALALASVGLGSALLGLANPHGRVLDQSRLVAVNVSRVAVSPEANRVGRLGAKLLARLQVGLELGLRELGRCRLGSLHLLPLGKDNQRQARQRDELDSA